MEFTKRRCTVCNFLEKLAKILQKIIEISSEIKVDYNLL